MLRKNLRTIIGAVALIVFVSIMMLVRASDALRLDITAHAIIVTRLRSDMITPFMEGFSALASPVVLVVMLIVVAAFAPGRRPGACAALNLGLVVALNTLLKDIVQRPRPEGFRLIDEFGYSFPSGHSMVAMAFYGLLVYLIWHYEHDRLMRWLWSGFMTAVIVMVGISRIYLGVHYASDVLAGFAISVAWLVFYTKVITPMFLPERFARHQKPDPASDPRRPRRRKRS
ncbi:MAG: phosphatase PAP2 family protein [Atopobiaceae bacterium]|nr:phosphatase PAP2 family protein [Atopobiaceae bacterium]